MRTLALLLALLLLPASAWGWTENYSWTNQGAGITYNVYICDWTTATTPCAAWVKSNAAPLATPAYVLTDANAFQTQVEIESCNAVGCSRRTGSGFFHDASRALPLASSNLTAQ